MVACDHVALLIHAEASVRITVIGESDVETFLDNELLQMFNMCTSAICIDVIAVRLIVHHICLCSERIEDALSDRPCGAICNIKTHLDVLEAVLGHGNEIADVAIAASRVVDSPADGACRERNLKSSVDIILDLEDRLLIHLLTAAVKELDAVIVVWVVRCGNHNAAVKIIYPCNISDRRSCRDMHNVGVGT